MFHAFFQNKKKEFSKEKKNVLRSWLKNAMGYSPANLHVFYPVFSRQGELQQERLELLGDAVFSMAVLDYLFRKFPLKTEGDLTQIKSRIVSRPKMNRIAEKSGLASVAEQLGAFRKGHDRYGNMLESLLGAMYLDAGYKKTMEIIQKKILTNYCPVDEIVQENDDYKSRLLRICQKNKWKADFFSEIKGKEICMKLLVNGECMAEGKGFRKKALEQTLSYHAIRKLEPEEHT